MTNSWLNWKNCVQNKGKNKYVRTKTIIMMIIVFYIKNSFWFSSRGLSSIRPLADSLQSASAKNCAISDNIANADTPGYKAKSVEFKYVLHQGISIFDSLKLYGLNQKGIFIGSIAIALIIIVSIILLASGSKFVSLYNDLSVQEVSKIKKELDS